MARSWDLAMRSGRRKSKGTTFLAADSCAGPAPAVVNNASISCCDKVRFKIDRPAYSIGGPHHSFSALWTKAQIRAPPADEMVGEQAVPRSGFMDVTPV